MTSVLEDRTLTPGWLVAPVSEFVPSGRSVTAADVASEKAVADPGVRSSTRLDTATVPPHATSTHTSPAVFVPLMTW